MEKLRAELVIEFKNSKPEREWYSESMYMDVLVQWKRDLEAVVMAIHKIDPSFSRLKFLTDCGLE